MFQNLFTIFPIIFVGRYFYSSFQLDAIERGHKHVKADKGKQKIT